MKGRERERTKERGHGSDLEYHRSSSSIESSGVHTLEENLSPNRSKRPPKSYNERSYRLHIRAATTSRGSEECPDPPITSPPTSSDTPSKIISSLSMPISSVEVPSWLDFPKQNSVCQGTRALMTARETPPSEVSITNRAERAYQHGYVLLYPALFPDHPLVQDKFFSDEKLPAVIESFLTQAKDLGHFKASFHLGLFYIDQWRKLQKNTIHQTDPPRDIEIRIMTDLTTKAQLALNCFRHVKVLSKSVSSDKSLDTNEKKMYLSQTIAFIKVLEDGLSNNPRRVHRKKPNGWTFPSLPKLSVPSVGLPTMPKGIMKKIKPIANKQSNGRASPTAGVHSLGVDWFRANPCREKTPFNSRHASEIPPMSTESNDGASLYLLASSDVPFVHDTSEDPFPWIKTGSEAGWVDILGHFDYNQISQSVESMEPTQGSSVLYDVNQMRMASFWIQRDEPSSDGGPLVEVSASHDNSQDIWPHDF